MIVDCFTFFNELDILELRLSVLESFVDRFVLCEAPFTFRGDPKPLWYAENKDRFARWNDRIVHLIYDAPADANPWNNEFGQRAHLTSALRGLAPDDLILIGDVDEIPEPALAGFRPEPGRIIAHRHVLAVGYVNRIVAGWIGTKAIAQRDLGERTLNDIRVLPFGAFDVIDSGWHFSAIGGANVMARKIRAYSHTEVDIPYLTDERRLTVQFESEVGASWAPLDGAFPAQLRDPRWSEYVWLGPAHEREEAEGLMHAYGCYASVLPGATKVGALVHAARGIWQRAGEERYGGGFAGAYGTVEELLTALPADGWAVVGELGQWPIADLAALAAHSVNAVVFATNARSFATLNAVVEGARFPVGPARGLREIEDALASARFSIERRDDVMGSVFPPAVLEQGGLFAVVAAPFGFVDTTSEAMHHFSTYAYVFTLRPTTL